MSLIKRMLDSDFAAVAAAKYRSGVMAGGGVVASREFLTKWIRLLKQIGQYHSTQLMFAGGIGWTIDPNTPGDTITTAFSADFLRNNLVQATKANQPLRVGQVWGIAEGMYNGNGGSRFMTHPAITYAADQPWSVVTSMNWNGRTATVGQRLFGDTVDLSAFFLDLGANTMLFRSNAGPTVVCGSNLFSGKNTVIALIATGAGKLNVIIGGVNTQYTINTDFVFASIFKAFTGQTAGIINAYRIQSGALTASQVDAEAALLSSQYPAIPSVTIGTQTWAVRNFDAVCTPMGNVIPEVTDNAAWAALTTPAWCHYNNDSANGAIYGKLYNQYAVDLLTADIATYNAANPTNRFGFHVPTQAEWTTLRDFLGGEAVAGGKLKQVGTTLWASPNTGATNESGFYALPCGFRRQDTGLFNGMLYQFTMWTITNTLFGYINRNAENALITSSIKARGCSIRLIKD